MVFHFWILYSIVPLESESSPRGLDFLHQYYRELSDTGWQYIWRGLAKPWALFPTGKEDVFKEIFGIEDFRNLRSNSAMCEDCRPRVLQTCKDGNAVCLLSCQRDSNTPLSGKAWAFVEVRKEVCRSWKRRHLISLRQMSWTRKRECRRFPRSIASIR